MELVAIAYLHVDSLDAAERITRLWLGEQAGIRSRERLLAILLG